MRRLPISDWDGIQYAKKAFGALVFPSGDYARWVGDAMTCANGPPSVKTFVVVNGDEYRKWIEGHFDCEQRGYDAVSFSNRSAEIVLTFAASLEDFLHAGYNPCYYDVYAARLMSSVANTDGPDFIPVEFRTASQSVKTRLMLPQRLTPWQRRDFVTAHVAENFIPGYWQVRLPMSGDVFHVTVNEREKTDETVPVPVESGERRDGRVGEPGADPSGNADDSPTLYEVPVLVTPDGVRGSVGVAVADGVPVVQRDHPSYGGIALYSGPAPGARGECGPERRGGVGDVGVGPGSLPDTVEWDTDHNRDHGDPGA